MVSKTTEPTPAHSEIGASTCPRWWECSGSVALIRKAPKQKTSFAAAEGTAAHEVAENALELIKKGKKVDLYKLIGTTKMVEGHEIEVTEEMIEAVIVYLETIKTNTKRFGTNLNFLSIEEQFQLDVDKDAWGRNDCFLYKPFDSIILWDYKHGKGITVEAKNNKQLMYYALGALKGREDIAKIDTYIVQPRAYHPEGAIRKHSYSVAELKMFEEKLKEKIAATREPNAPLKAGKHCKFCPAIAICPEVKAETNEVAKRDFAEVSSLDIETMIHLTEMAPRIVDFLKEVEKHLKVKAEQGAEVPGFKLVKAQSNRKYKNEQRVITEFRPKYKDAIFSPAKLKTPAQLEKILSNKDELLPFIEKPDRGLSLVPDSDPRKAVKSSASEDFKDIL